MATKDDKARVRVFFGEIEGDNATIRDGLRSIAEAVNKTFQQNTKVVRVLAAGSNGDSKQLADNIEEIVLEPEFTEDFDDEPDSISNTTGEKKKGKPKKPISYSFVKDLNLRPDGTISLREFFNEKKPSDQQQILTVIIYYLYRKIGVQNISVSHIYNGLKELTEFGVRVPPDIANTLRKIVTRKGWLDTSNLEATRTTTGGDNFVEHDLPKSKTTND
jgi:hypothetical protein